MSIRLLLVFLVISACGSVKFVEEEEVKVYARIVNNYNDSCGDLCNRFVYSHIPCDSLQFLNKQGKVIPRYSVSRKDSLSCWCNNIESPNSKMMNQASNEKYSRWYTIGSDGFVSISGMECYKEPWSVLKNFPDSVSVVVWNKLYDNGRFVFYAAEESTAWPYYKPGRIDSFVVDLENFCTEDEKLEQRKSMQSYYDRNYLVKVTPNPFKESIEMQITSDIPKWFLFSEEQKLTFYDDKGNVLETKMVSPNNTYTFSFPNIGAGKTIIYRITWDVYSISGQILKAS